MNNSKSKAAILRWAEPEQRAMQSERAKKRVGIDASRSKTWSLETPSKKLKLVTGCRQFCKENKLSYSALKRKASIRDTSPVSRGLSKGWSVLVCTDKI